MILVHMMVCGLSGKHGGIDTMKNEWLYVVYNIFIGQTNIVNLHEALWQDFVKFTKRRKLIKIISRQF